jgi:hypothetical protein
VDSDNPSMTLSNGSWQERLRDTARNGHTAMP